MSDDIDRVIDAPLGKPIECSHPWRHTVYGSADPKKNGTICQMCGMRLR